MNSLEINDIFNIKPFNFLSKEYREKLKRNLTLKKVNSGEKIFSLKKDLNYLYVIKSGDVRIMGKSKDNKLSSYSKLEKGNFIGLNSSVLEIPCENIIASGDLELFVIAVPFWNEILQRYEEINNWIKKTLFLEEYFLLNLHLYNKSPKLQVNIFNLFREYFKDSGVIPPVEELVNQKINEGFKLYNLSNSSKNFRLYEEVTNKNIQNVNLKDNQRLIFLSNELIKIIDGSVSKKEMDVANNSSVDGIRDKDSKNKFKIIFGKDKISQDLATLKMLTNILEIPIREDSVKLVLEDFKKNNTSIDLKTYGKIISSFGLQVSISTFFKDDLNRLDTPSLIILDDCLRLIKEVRPNSLVIASPEDGFIEFMIDELEEKYPEGIPYLIFNKINITPSKKFNLNWFVPVISKYKLILFQVLISSFVIQLLTLANPLLIQVIIDKVISQRSLDTLQVLGIALFFITIVEGFLISIKTFLFAETTNRIDQRLGSEVVDHLYRLPLEFFDKRAVGELGTRVDELEKIRNFITGQGLTTILDSLFSIIYIGIMLIYSVKLTLISLIVLPIQILITIFGAPLFRKQYRETAQNNAKTKSHLVETLNGIQTIKAQNIETDSRWKWQNLYSKYISSSFKKTITSTGLNQSSQVLQKISQLLVLWIGASMVLDGKLTLGQLIAFRIISSYVTQPILRLSGVWQSVQELNVSFERLGDIINISKEKDILDNQNISIPSIKGLVKFSNVDFRFTNTNSNSLSNINLEINPGTFVGIVGKSGSGKSTLLKLIPRLYKSSKGTISVDNYDVNKVDLYSLRRQIGIVPQEPLLFAGSIMDNLIINNQNASDEMVVEATSKANAHDFIMNMPNGYNTQIGERGSSMSGGQRQRIAIARTLLSKPKLLIFDEATSALDYESEKIIVNNLISSYKDVTILFVSHRLESLKNADLLIMMDNGKVVESGTHGELINNKGLYSSLYYLRD